MIPQYNGMKAEQTTFNTPLPAGGYVATIINVKIQNYSWGSVLVIAFDIAEGEYKNFFRKQFDSNTNSDKKWKGTYRAVIPNEKSQYFENERKTFNNLIYSLEDSNNGYHYDCDEQKFKEKAIGVIYRNKEWEMNGNSGWTTECGAVTDVKAIRENTFKPLKDKRLKNKPSAALASTYAPLSTYDDSNDEDLPF